MPAEAVWFVRAAMVHLCAGFGIGAVMLAAKDLSLSLPGGVLVPMHRDLVLIGWMAQLTLGVAHWILPRHARGSLRGSVWTARSGCMLLNLGVITAALGRPLGFAPAGYTALLAAGLVLLGGLLPRVKAFGAN